MSVDEDRYENDILAVCDSLHGEFSGSSEGCLSRDEIRQFVRWLRRRIDQWEPTLGGKSKRYDEAVKAIVEVVLEEAKEQGWTVGDMQP